MSAQSISNIKKRGIPPIGGRFPCMQAVLHYAQGVPQKLLTILSKFNFIETLFHSHNSVTALEVWSQLERGRGEPTLKHVRPFSE